MIIIIMIIIMITYLYSAFSVNMFKCALQFILLTEEGSF